MAAQNPLDQNTLEIKTKSIEQTLLPLVKQVNLPKIIRSFVVI